MPEPPTRDLGIRPGDVIAGKYRVSRVLGAGAMGLVVAAHHVQLDTKVAIKLLLPELLANDEAVARFAREARAVAKLTTEHVARVLDVGTLETGVPFMVMEYLEGQDLAARLDTAGALPVEEAVDFIVQTCVALAEAHGHGIVHRDLKPANLFCIRRPDGQLSIKVLDFGISKLTVPGAAASPASFSVTKQFDVIGSPLYMSPEQMKASRHADAQSDIWALGVILYQLLAADVPFTGESETDIAINVASKPPRPLRGFRPDVPPRLEAVILKCLEKDRADRYRNVADLASELAPFAPTRAWGAIERIAGTIETARQSVTGLSAPASTPPPAGEIDVNLDPLAPPMPEGDRGAITLLGQSKQPGSHAGGLASGRAGLVGAGLLGLLVIGGAAVFLVRTASTSPQDAPTATRSSAAPPPAPAAPDAPAAVPVAPTTASTASVAAAPSTATAPESPSATPRADTPVPVAPTAAPAAPGRPAGAPPRRATSAPVGCDPPYTLDDEGRKHFRPECFLKR